MAGSAATREDRRRNRGPKRFIVGAVALIIGGLLTAGALGDVAPITFTGSSASSDTSAATDTTAAASDSTASSDSSMSSDTTSADSGASSTTASLDSSGDVPGRYIVTFEAGVTKAQQAAAIADAGATDISAIAPLRMHAVDASDAAVAALEADAAVSRVEADQVRDVQASPNDPEYANQWSLPRIGWDQVYGTVAPVGLGDRRGPRHRRRRLAPGSRSGSVVPGTSILDGSSGDDRPERPRHRDGRHRRRRDRQRHRHRGRRLRRRQGHAGDGARRRRHRLRTATSSPASSTRPTTAPT